MKTILGATALVVFIDVHIHATALAAEQPSGFYLMQGLHQQNVRDDVLASPEISGIHLRDQWSLVEPDAPTNSFSWLDLQVDRAKALGKNVSLGIYAGISSPTWLNVPLYNNVPLPWDPAVLAAHNSMVADLGAHFANENAITAVHISSPATSRSLEMFLPEGLINVPGYSDQQIIDVWKSSIDAYAAAFPNKALVLDVAMAPDSRGAITDAVMDYAETTLGDRINFIHCSLKATTSSTAPHHQRVVAARLAGASIGFEMVSPSSDTLRFGGSFADALAIGQAAGASWYQIYQSDIPNIPDNFFSIPGDFNHDGLVSTSDYVVWRNTIGTADLRADGNGNGRVDNFDYAIWRSQLGQANSASAVSANSPLPEPATICMAIFGASIFAIGRRRRARV
jgi:hypothetical protein